jgi:hypothetical protein
MAWERDWTPRHWTGLALVAAALMLAAPLWWVRAPAMPDYPAHLASFHLIADGGNAFYSLKWCLVPNLAAEVLVPLLGHLTGMAIAAKLFMTVAVFLWVLGPGAIHRALYGRTGLAPLLGAFFAYNANFMWGFFNYYFAAGLSFALFAAWIANDTSPRRDAPWRLAGFALAITILYFCHIFAAAALLLMIAGYETMQNRRLEEGRLALLLRRALRAAALYLPAALAFVFLKPASAGGARLEFNLLDTLLDRYESLIQHDFDNAAYVLPALLFAGLAAALYARKARLHPAMTGVLALLLVASLVAPEWAMGGWAVHLRLPAMFAVMLFASTELRMTPRVRAVLAASALVLIGWNAAALARDWQGYDRQYSEFRAALPQLPRGQRLLTVLDGDAIGLASDQPYWHMAEFAVHDRGDFTPLLFTTRGQHVVQLRNPRTVFAAATAQQGSPPDIDELNVLSRGEWDGDVDIRDIFPYLMYFQCHYDVAVVIHRGGPRSPVPPMLHLRHAGSFFTLYDIKPDAACAKR